MVLDVWVVLALGLVGVTAGFVDAIAGGGGLIGVPALLVAGLPPLGALATNKLQGAIGTAVAAFTFWRRGFVKPSGLIVAILTTYAGGVFGAFVVSRLETSTLSVFIPVALIAVSIYFLLAPKLSDEDRTARLSFKIFVPVFGAVIGFYDGVFGPGTGSFFTVAFIAVFGLGVTRAAAHTKVLNLVSNCAALTFFIPSGHVVWPVAMVMAVGQIVGGYLGALTGIRFGARLIKPLVVVVSLLLAGRSLLFR